MTTPRAIRLQQDYDAMLAIKGRVINWEPADKRKPPESYIVHYYLTGMISSSSTIQHHIVEIKLIAEYPDVAPIARFTSKALYHPHVYNSGKVCVGGYSPDENLAAFCLRIAKYIQFQPSIINLKSPANSSAMSWFKTNNKRLPIDNTILPDLPDTRFVVKSRSSTPTANTFTPKQIRRN